MGLLYYIFRERGRFFGGKLWFFVVIGAFSRVLWRYMNLRAFTEVMEQAEGVRDGALIVLLVLCYFADENGRCWPGVRVLARRSRLSTRQVRTIVNRLAAEGHIRIA